MQELAVDCPYCGERFNSLVDSSGGSQAYVEDCPVCCRPIEYHLEVSLEGQPKQLTARRDDE